MRLAWIFLVAAAAGCASKAKPPAKTERERDSIVAQSRLPGAKGVGAALRVSDSAAARRARLDSVAQ